MLRSLIDISLQRVQIWVWLEMLSLFTHNLLLAAVPELVLQFFCTCGVIPWRKYYMKICVIYQCLQIWIEQQRLGVFLSNRGKIKTLSTGPHVCRQKRKWLLWRPTKQLQVSQEEIFSTSQVPCLLRLLCAEFLNKSHRQPLNVLTNCLWIKITFQENAK